MVRVTQFKIRWYLIAVPTIGYLCAFREIAVLLGIFLASLLFLAPIVVMVSLVCRYWVGTPPSLNPGRSGLPAPSVASEEPESPPPSRESSPFSETQGGEIAWLTRRWKLGSYAFAGRR
jgi:hypothetical protein